MMREGMSKEGIKCGVDVTWCLLQINRHYTVQEYESKEMNGVNRRTFWILNKKF